MRTFRSIAVGILFFGFVGIYAQAQVPVAVPPAQPGRIYVINPNVFGDDKAGINKYINGLKALNTEFTPLQNELAAMVTKSNTLAAELKALQDQAAKNVPIDQVAARNKSDEYDRLQREFKFKQDDAKAKYDKRESVVMGPIRQEIAVVLLEFSKKGGYWMILDAGKLDEAGLFLALDDNADITKAFVQYFNTRPATAAAPK